MEQQTAAMLSLVDVLRNGVFLPVGLSKFSLSVYKVQNHGQRPAPGSLFWLGELFQNLGQEFSQPLAILPGVLGKKGRVSWRRSPVLVALRLGEPGTEERIS